MNSPQTAVTHTAHEIGRMALELAGHTAGDLIQKATAKTEPLPLAEVEKRLKAALEALQGPPLALRIEAKEVALQVADEMVNSYSFDPRSGVSTFTIPAGLSDVNAMRVLNTHFQAHYPHLDRGVIRTGDFHYYEDLPRHYPSHCTHRGFTEQRDISIISVVKETIGKDREGQVKEAGKQGLSFSDPRDQVLAFALHACKHGGEYPFNELLIRGCVPSYALRVRENHELATYMLYPTAAQSDIAASGSPTQPRLPA